MDDNGILIVSPDILVCVYCERGLPGAMGLCSLSRNEVPSDWVMGSVE